MRAVSSFTNTLSLLAAILLAASLAPLPAWADTADSTLYAFKGGRDGSLPYGRLASDSSGNLYGTTASGGRDCHPGCGTVFKLTPRGKEKILHAFQGDDGSEPRPGVLLDGAGNIYGAAGLGGANDFGTIFKIAPDGTETVLYSFKGGSDGAGPVGDLFMDIDGTLYGTTYQGGGSANCQGGCGTVFKLPPDGQESVLYAFQGGSDGINPTSGVSRDGSGNFYGTTYNGGNSPNCNSGCGIVYKISPDGAETVLHTFQGADGAWPYGGVILDQSGNLYGTTSMGGDAGAGTVFRLAPDGTETVLYSFKRGLDGAGPLAGLIVDKKGNFYGTTSGGGGTEGCHRNGCGTVFKLTPDGKKTTLLTFDNKNGNTPLAALLLGKRGELYGTTVSGGHHQNGVVFQVKK